MTRHLKKKILERAAQILGDNDRLASLLEVDRHALELWLSGRATLPERVFTDAMELVLQDDIARAAQDRRAQPRLPEPVRASV